MSTQNHYSAIVVGGGIVGLATARELLCRHPDFKLALLVIAQMIVNRAEAAFALA